MGETGERRLVVGVGLNSKATTGDVADWVNDALATIGATAADVLAIATAEHRRGHPALDGLLAQIGLTAPIVYVAAEHFPRAGEVAETAARNAAHDGELLLTKRCNSWVCVAIAAAQRMEVRSPSMLGMVRSMIQRSAQND